MIKLEVIDIFTLERFNELKNIKRKAIDTGNQLNVGDTFECEKDLADYLLGGNRFAKPYVKVIEVIPDEQIKKPKKKTSKK